MSLSNEFNEGSVFPTPLSKKMDGKGDIYSSKSRKNGMTKEDKAPEAARRILWTTMFTLGAILTVSLVLVTVELFVLLALGSGRMNEMSAEMTTLLKRINEGESAMTADVNFGMRDFDLSNIDFGNLISPFLNGHSVKTNGTKPANVTAIEAGELSNDMKWCLKGNCTQGLDCEKLISGLYSGLKDDGVPNIPFPDEFCSSVTAMNDNLCFCNDLDTMKTDVDDSAFTAMINGLPVIQILCQIKPKTIHTDACSG